MRLGNREEIRRNTQKHPSKNPKQKPYRPGYSAHNSFLKLTPMERFQTTPTLNVQRHACGKVGQNYTR